MPLCLRSPAYSMNSEPIVLFHRLQLMLSAALRESCYFGFELRIILPTVTDCAGVKEYLRTDTRDSGNRVSSITADPCFTNVIFIV